MVKNPPDDPLEEEIATHAWETPWTEEPGGYSPGGRKESDPTERQQWMQGGLLPCAGQRLVFLAEFKDTKNSELFETASRLSR